MLKRKGLTMTDSECTVDHAGLVNLNLRLLSGAAAKEAIADFQCMLDAPETDDVWYSALGVQKGPSVIMILMGIADTYRRLVLPSECLPWQMFSLLQEVFVCATDP